MFDTLVAKYDLHTTGYSLEDNIDVSILSCIKKPILYSLLFISHYVENLRSLKI